MPCEVCDSPDGKYAIMTARGEHWGLIDCPACCGTGLNDGEADLAARQRCDRQRYEASLSEMRELKPAPQIHHLFPELEREEL